MQTRRPWTPPFPTVPAPSWSNQPRDHSPQIRSQHARLSNDCARVVTSRVTRRSSRPDLEWPEDHRWTKSSDRRAAPSGPPLVRVARRLLTHPAPQRHRVTHLVSFRITSRRSLPTAKRSEDHLAEGRSCQPAVTFEPPCEQLFSDGLGPSLGDASSTHVVSRRITKPAFLPRPQAARRPPLDKRLLPAGRHLRTAL